jgi:hypothetical protein
MFRTYIAARMKGANGKRKLGLRSAEGGLFQSGSYTQLRIFLFLSQYQLVPSFHIRLPQCIIKNNIDKHNYPADDGFDNSVYHP